MTRTAEERVAVRIERTIQAAPHRVYRAWLDPGLVKRCTRARLELLGQLGVEGRHAQRDLPILADTLEEVGCTNADILDHCRKPGEHVRGCWVADLL